MERCVIGEGGNADESLFQTPVLVTDLKFLNA